MNSVHPVQLIVVTLQIDFSGDIGQMIASLLLHIAQMERNRILERQQAGIAAAKERGVKWGGRKEGTRLIAYDRAIGLRDRGLTIAEIARALGCSRQSLYVFFRTNGPSRKVTDQ